MNIISFSSRKDIQADKIENKSALIICKFKMRKRRRGINRSALESIYLKLHCRTENEMMEEYEINTVDSRKIRKIEKKLEGMQIFSLGFSLI